VIEMRDYNYRKRMKDKEMRKRKELYYNRGYWPTMPERRVNEKGQEYYIQGYQCNRKKYLKKYANKSVRRSELDSISNGSNYKKVYDLVWEWY
jgi:hypothetical protein